MLIVSPLFPIDVIWRFMYHIVEKKAENYNKLFILIFHQYLRKSKILEMLRFFFRSVYMTKIIVWGGTFFNPVK